MTTITYKNIHNYKFNEIKKIVESELELEFNNDFVEKNTNEEIVYCYKQDGQYLNIYTMQLYLYKDCKSRIKLHLNCKDRSVTKGVWFFLLFSPVLIFLSFFPLLDSVSFGYGVLTASLTLLVIAQFGKYDSDNLVKAKLDKHFL